MPEHEEARGGWHMMRGGSREKRGREGSCGLVRSMGGSSRRSRVLVMAASMVVAMAIHGLAEHPSVARGSHGYAQKCMLKTEESSTGPWRTSWQHQSGMQVLRW